MPDVISSEEVGEEGERVGDLVGGRFSSVEGKGVKKGVGEEGEDRR